MGPILLVFQHVDGSSGLVRMFLLTPSAVVSPLVRLILLGFINYFMNLIDFQDPWARPTEGARANAPTSPGELSTP